MEKEKYIILATRCSELIKMTFLPWNLPDCKFGGNREDQEVIWPIST